MAEQRYSIWIDGEKTAVVNDLDNALLFAKALFEAYFEEPKLEVTVRREPEEET